MTYERLSDQIENTLLENRRLFLCDSVDSNSMQEAIRRLWYLELVDPKAPIVLVINSPGGSIDSGLALWDQIQGLKCPFYTVVAGMAASMGSVLSIAAKKGSRFAFPNSRIMIHQPSIGGVVRGQATDLEITAKEILKTREKLVDIYAKATGQSKKVIDEALDRDRWFSAQEALEFGLLDKVITSLDELPTKPAKKA